MKITRGDQFEIGDRVLINGEPFVAYKQEEECTLFKHELDSANRCDYYIHNSHEINKGSFRVEINTLTTQNTVKVENESDKKVRIEKLGEAVVVTVY